MSSDYNALKYIDKTTILLYLLLALFGCMNIYSASITPDQTSIFDISCHSGMQILWVVISILFVVLLFFIDGLFFIQFAYIFFAAMLLLLVVTIFLSHDINGSRSWLSFGAFSIQPAEFAKLVTALAMARFLGEKTNGLQRLSDYLHAILIFLIPMLLIVLQKETGTALVFISFLLLFYREGMSGLVLLLSSLAILLFVLTIRLDSLLFFGIAGFPLGIVIAFFIIMAVALCFLLYYRRDLLATAIILGSLLLVTVVGVLLNFFFVQFPIIYLLLGYLICVSIYLLVLSIRHLRRAYWLIALFVIVFSAYSYSADYIFNHILQPHQQKRIKVVLAMVDDPKGVGYNTRQAAIAIGSGCFTGKGYMNGTQTRLKYVPEQHTDFIFCTIGEEWGFIGCLLVIAAYTLLMWRIVVMAERAESHAVRVYGYSVLGFFAFHFIVNIGMVIGVVPVIGIPLPFISYGGSSFLGFTLMLALLIKLDSMRVERLKSNLGVFTSF